MKRYQLYLNPQSVSVLDDIGDTVDISRSKIIQMVLDGIASNFAKIFRVTQTPPKKTYILDSLVGFVKIKGNKKTNFAQNIDEIYLSD